MKGNGRRMQDFFHRAFAKLYPHEQDDERYDEPCDVFKAAVPERVFRVRLLRGEPKSEQRDRGRPSVGEIIERVGRDGDGAAQNAYKELGDAQQRIEQDAHRTTEDAVGLPHLGGSSILKIGDAASGQKAKHKKTPFAKE